MSVYVVTLRWLKFVCMYLCMYVYMYVFLYYVFLYYVCMYFCTYVCISVCMYVFLYVRVCMYFCMYVFMYFCMYEYVCISVCMCVCISVCMYVCISVCMYFYLRSKSGACQPSVRIPNIVIPESFSGTFQESGTDTFLSLVPSSLPVIFQTVLCLGSLRFFLCALYFTFLLLFHLCNYRIS